MRNTFERSAGLLILLGSAIWLVATYFGGQFDTGVTRIAGFTEQDYRAFLNPALILILAGVVASRQPRTGGGASRGWGRGLIASGLALSLLGNWLEYGPVPSLSGTGWGVFLLGWLVVGPLGAVVMTIADVRAPVLPGVARFGLLLLAILPILTLGSGFLWLGVGAFAVGWGLQGLALLRPRPIGMTAPEPALRP